MATQRTFSTKSTPHLDDQIIFDKITSLHLDDEAIFSQHVSQEHGRLWSHSQCSIAPSLSMHKAYPQFRQNTEVVLVLAVWPQLFSTSFTLIGSFTDVRLVMSNRIHAGVKCGHYNLTLIIVTTPIKLTPMPFTVFTVRFL